MHAGRLCVKEKSSPIDVVSISSDRLHNTFWMCCLSIVQYRHSEFPITASFSVFHQLRTRISLDWSLKASFHTVWTTHIKDGVKAFPHSAVDADRVSLLSTALHSDTWSTADKRDHAYDYFSCAIDHKLRWNPLKPSFYCRCLLSNGLTVGITSGWKHLCSSFMWGGESTNR